MDGFLGVIPFLILQFSDNMSSGKTSIGINHVELIIVEKICIHSEIERSTYFAVLFQLSSKLNATLFGLLIVCTVQESNEE